jgi:uncharacterized damage-inducible protein DinB
MITPAYVRTMAVYNSEMNRRLYAAAGRLDDAERRAARGVFWGSILGTFNHLMWGDLMWMSRFANWPNPGTPINESDRMFDDFDALRAHRTVVDADIEAWAAGVTDDWLAEDLTWFSAAVLREVRGPRTLLVAGLFNHQTHHRGQAHALLTAAGEDTGGTDLPFIILANPNAP